MKCFAILVSTACFAVSLLSQTTSVPQPLVTYRWYSATKGSDMIPSIKEEKEINEQGELLTYKIHQYSNDSWALRETVIYRYDQNNSIIETDHFTPRLFGEEKVTSYSVFLQQLDPKVTVAETFVLDSVDRSKKIISKNRNAKDERGNLILNESIFIKQDGDSITQTWVRTFDAQNRMLTEQFVSTDIPGIKTKSFKYRGTDTIPVSGMTVTDRESHGVFLKTIQFRKKGNVLIETEKQRQIMTDLSGKKVKNKKFTNITTRKKIYDNNGRIVMKAQYFLVGKSFPIYHNLDITEYTAEGKKIREYSYGSDTSRFELRLTGFRQFYYQALESEPIVLNGIYAAHQPDEQQNVLVSSTHAYPVKYHITDTQEKTVQSGEIKIPNQNISFAKLPKGIYYLHVLDKDRSVHIPIIHQ
jgi:hypothetical protein